MNQHKGIQRLLSVLLVALLLVGLLPTAFADDSTDTPVNLVTEDGWVVKIGNEASTDASTGSYTKNDDGTLTVAAGAENANGKNTKAYVSLPEVANAAAGTLTTTFDASANTSAGTTRYAVIFRYTDKDNWAAVGYDGTRWYVQVMSTSIAATDIKQLSVNANPTDDEITVSVRYSQDTIESISINEETLTNNITPNGFANLAAGTIGYQLATSTALTVSSLTMAAPGEGGGTEEPDPAPEEPGWTEGEDGLIDYTLSTTATSNWEIAHGASTIVSQDGALVMTTSNGNESNNPAYALQYDTASPDLASGELEAVIENNFAGRFCLVFRYQDKDNYAAVGYDWGNWVIKTRVNGTETTDTFAGPDTRSSGEHTVKVTFWDNAVQVDVDGTTYYTSSTFLEGAPAEGQLGLRTWGYSQNYASLTVKRLTYNETPSPEFDEDGNYMVTFTDDMHRGGWQQDAANTSGWNGLSFTDGEGADGYMTVSAGPTGTANGNTIFSDLRAPVIDNGFIEMDLTDVGSGGRIGIYFRYTSPDQHVGLMYDIGNWQLRVNGQDVSQLGTYALTSGQTYHLRIEYVGNNVRLLIDGNEVFDKTLDSVDIGAGRIGLRVWGYETQLGAAKVDNVVNGEFNAVLLDPDQVTLMRDEAAYPVAIELSQTANAFQEIKVNDVALTLGDDYTVSGSTVTLTEQYIEACKAAGTEQTLAFVFEDGYIAYFTLKVQGEAEAVEHYYRDFADGIEGFERVTGNGAVAAEDGVARITGAQNSAIFLDQNSPSLRNVEAEFTFDPANDVGNVAVVLRYVNASDWLAVGIAGVGGNHTQWYAYTPSGTYALFADNDDLLTENGGNSAGDGQRLYSGRAKPYTLKVRVVEETITVWLDGAELLQSTIPGLPDSAGQVGLWLNAGAGADVYDLTVNTSNSLTRVTEEIETKTIASSDLTVTLDQAFPRVVSYELDGKTLAGQEIPYYAVEINNTLCEMEVTSSFTGTTATYQLTGTLDGETVSLDVVFSVEKNVLTMEIQNASANIYTVNFPNHNLVSVSSDEPGAALRESNYSKEHVYDLTTRGASANHKYTSLAVLNNSELAAAVTGGTFKNRGEICYQTVRLGAETTTGLWPNEYILRDLNGDALKGNNTAHVAIAADRNGDGKVDYQDGAIALRDDLPNSWYNTEEVFNAYTSIAVNEASWAQYPFLTALDNIKKMSLGTDGFPQLVVYKGYQSQGHDSAHPDFGNVNEQAGGVEDLQILTEKAAEYNATIGVHINETEVYPESEQFGVLASDNAGWFWFDQANQMIRENDILDGVEVPGGNMYDRLDELDEVTGGNLGYVYVDTYFDNRWPAYALASALQEHGWAVGTEYVDELTAFSVWAHHIGSSFNNAGNLVRFVTNGTKDIFGYSNLFRGPSARHTAGIFGWQADPVYGQNYQNTLEDFYIRILPNKYLGNFDIMQWETDNQAVLKGNGKTVVTEMVNGVNQITVDGKLIANGNTIFIPWDPVDEGKIYHWNQAGGTTEWELPASWSGETTVQVFRLSDEGRTNRTVVEVKDGKISLTAEAKTPYVVYKGSDTTVEETDLTEYNWTEGGNVADAGFDSHTWDYAWDVSSTSGSTDHITYSNANGTVIGQGDTNALISGTADGTIHQTITGLEGGKSYAVSVYTDTSDGRRATLTVVTPDGSVYSQYTDGGNGIYGGSHSSKKRSGYERLEVQITLPAGATTAELYLTSAAGASETAYTRFDDVRVYELDNAPDTEGHYYFDDFEDFAVGFGLFQNGIAGSNHMSETSAFNNDTIEGRYSLKIQELGLGSAYTTPAALRFPANTEVTVTFDYLLNSGSYTLTAKEADGTALNAVTLEPTGMGSANAQEASLTFTTGGSGKAYLELTRTGGTLVLDNITVDVVESEAGAVAITTSANEGGTVTAAASAQLGSDVTVTITPDAGYEVKSVTVNGVPAAAKDGMLTLRHIQGAQNVQVTFEGEGTEPEPETYTISVTQAQGGTIAPETTEVNEGESLTFTFTAAEGYELTDVVVDGKSVGVQNPYTFTNVTADHTITAVFTEKIVESELEEIAEALESRTYSVSQSKVNTGAAASAYMQTRIDGLLPEGVTGTIHSVSFTAAKAGTLLKPKGTDGAYVFTVTLNDGTSTYTTEEITLVIEATEYTLPVRPTRPGGSGTTDKPAAQTEFYDVATTAWYYDAVMYVCENGYMNGVAEGQFNPDGAVTRAMVWTVLARMDGENTEGGSTWYAKAQAWAMETGVSDGTDPNGAITREQLATMLYRYIGSPVVSGSLSGYPDAGSVSDWAENALVWATQTGLVNGINGNLSPKTGATRAQLATMLMRLMES